jgi:hypothetical protein
MSAAKLHGLAAAVHVCLHIMTCPLSAIADHSDSERSLVMRSQVTDTGFTGWPFLKPSSALAVIDTDGMHRTTADLRVSQQLTERLISHRQWHTNNIHKHHQDPVHM